MSNAIQSHVFCVHSELKILNGVLLPEGISVLVPLRDSVGSEKDAFGFWGGLELEVPGGVYRVSDVMK